MGADAKGRGSRTERAFDAQEADLYAAGRGERVARAYDPENERELADWPSEAPSVESLSPNLRPLSEKEPSDRMPFFNSHTRRAASKRFLVRSKVPREGAVG